MVPTAGPDSPDGKNHRTIGHHLQLPEMKSADSASLDLWLHTAAGQTHTGNTQKDKTQPNEETVATIGLSHTRPELNVKTS